MHMKLIDKGTVGEVLLEGSLDAKTAGEAEALLKQLIDRFDEVILNMNDLKYISSAGLRVIKIIHVGMKKKGGRLVLTHVNKMVMEVFEITGFAGLLNIE